MTFHFIFFAPPSSSIIMLPENSTISPSSHLIELVGTPPLRCTIVRNAATTDVVGVRACISHHGAPSHRLFRASRDHHHDSTTFASLHLIEATSNHQQPPYQCAPAPTPTSFDGARVHGTCTSPTLTHHAGVAMAAPSWPVVASPSRNHHSRSRMQTWRHFPATAADLTTSSASTPQPLR